MAVAKEKTGKDLVNELGHTFQFLQKMGFETIGMTISECTTIKQAILKSTIKLLGEPTHEVKDAF